MGGFVIYEIFTIVLFVLAYMYCMIYSTSDKFMGPWNVISMYVCVHKYTSTPPKRLHGVIVT